jgi:hypothetical protein
MSNDEQDEEMICALTADEFVALRKGLRELPQTMPPREVWNRIREQAQAEGLFAMPRRNRNWLAGFGVAATIALVAVVMTVDRGTLEQSNGAVPPYVVQSNPEDLSGLRALMVESSQLESDLRALPDAPRVARAGTVATLGEIHDRIAAIDYQLNDPQVTMSPEDREIFWRERVRMMKLLLQLRYAQAQRTAY